MPNYGCPKYWDDRYENTKEESGFDWLENFYSLKGILQEFLTHKDMNILILGCGNAEFSADLYDEGYHNIVNVDISSVVVAQMHEKHKEDRPKMHWVVMDITEMDEFDDDSFDLAIDKSTIDALLCGEDTHLMVAKMLKET